MDRRTDRPTDGPTKRGVESRARDLKIENLMYVDQTNKKIGIGICGGICGGIYGGYMVGLEMEEGEGGG